MASTRRRVGVGMVVFASVGHALAYLVAAPEHVVDTSWPLHARFHVLQALLWVVGFDLLTLPVALGPLMRGERWAAWSLLAAAVCLHGAYFVSMVAFPDGRPPELYAHVVMGVLTALFVGGVLVGWPSKA